MCCQYFSCLINVISSIILRVLQWSLQIKWLTFVFCFVFRKEVKYFFWKMEKSQSHLSMSNVSISEWPSSNCLYSAHALVSFSKQGDNSIFCFPLGSLSELALERRSLEIEHCRWNRKSTFDWRIALEFVSRSEVEADYASRVTKSSVMFSQYWKGREPTVHSYYCHTYRSTSLLIYLSHCICIQTKRN